MQDETNPSAASADVTDAESAAKPNVDVMPSLEEALKAAELTAAEHHDAWLRARADMETCGGAHRATSTTHASLRSRICRRTAGGQRQLEAALATEVPSIEVMKDGVELTLKQLSAVFGKFSLAEINPVGEKFDPHQHQAIGMVESDQAANTVVSVLQKGYTLNERTIRPALVMVAKGSA
jgi:Molecular chaperone GrpE (heat shock protein)